MSLFNKERFVEFFNRLRVEINKNDRMIDSSGDRVECQYRWQYQLALPRCGQKDPNEQRYDLYEGRCTESAPTVYKCRYCHHIACHEHSFRVEGVQYRVCIVCVKNALEALKCMEITHEL